jgi:hopanoid C-3 methylase
MRILLVQPTPFEEGRLGLENVVWLSEPVALTAVAGSVPEHDVQVLDLRLEPENTLARAIKSFRPDVVGTTSMTTDAYQAKAVLRTAKTMLPDCLTVVGGHHPTMSPLEFREPYVDLIVKGEGELTFKELIAAELESRQNAGIVELADASDAERTDARQRARRAFERIAGLESNTPDRGWLATAKREQQRSLDALPKPRRDLVRRYRGGYFFTVARPMASIFTSRGCSFDCNFCAIWEFYDRRTRFLSAEAIADQMAACEEDYIFVLDDNFLTDVKRIRRLVEVLRERKLEKFWMTQGRTDFIAQHPDVMRDLASVGLMCVLCGYESNDEDALAALKKSNTVNNNREAARVLRENGIQSTGIFMARPDFEEKDFKALYEYINDLGIAVPIVTLHTPLPGTQLEKKLESKLLTKDRRFFDLLHAVVPTKLPREDFYAEFAKQLWATMPSTKRALAWRTLIKRKDFWLSVLPNVPRFLYEANRHRKVFSDPRSYLWDEAGVLDGKATTNLHRIVPVTQLEEHVSGAASQPASPARLPVLAS